MPRFRALFCRLLGLVRKQSREAEMNAEIQQHLDALTERNIAAGMSPKEVRNVSVRVSLSRPSGLIANSRIVVLDQGFSIHGALINAAIQDVHEQHEPAANKKASRGHNLLFSRIILAADRSFNAIRKLARAIPLSREIFLSCSQPKAQKAIYSVDNHASPRHLPSWKREEFDREIRILYGSDTITSPTNFLPRLV